MDKSNIVILSKNRDTKKNPTSSEVDIILPQSINCDRDEHFTISINQFHMVKSFYSIQNNLNNVFYIVLRSQTDPEDVNEYIRAIPSGAYNVKTLLTELKKLSLGLVSVDYDSILNKMKFIRIENETTVGYDAYIKCVNCGIILGLEDGVEKLITEEGVMSDTFCNISGYNSMFIKLQGLSLERSFVNFTSQDFGVNNIIGICDLADVQPFDIIEIKNNTDCNSNKFKINSKSIQSFTIQIVNENNQEFPQMSDYIMDICIEKHSSRNDSKDFKQLFEALIKMIQTLTYYFMFFIKSSGLIDENDDDD
jgi:hypothetical protein